MSKKSKNRKTPRPSELLGKSTPEEETPDETQVAAKEETPEPKEAPSLEDIVNNLPEEMRVKAQADRNEQARQFASFNNALLGSETGVAKWLEALAETHKVSLAGRKITIIYPKADEEAKAPAVSNVPKGKKGNGGNGNREGFPTGWGEAELVKEGKVIQTE